MQDVERLRLHTQFIHQQMHIFKTLITIYIKIRWLLHVSVYDHHQGACVLCALHSTQYTPFWDMLPHHHIINYDVTLLNVLISI